MSPAGVPLSSRAMGLCQAFLRSFAQTVKMLSLYQAGHPVPTSAMEETWHLLHDILSEKGWSGVTFALVGGRWMANDSVIAESARAYELIAIVFRSHALQSVTFSSGCRFYELSTLCELMSTPPNRAYETDAADFMKERGVKHISLNVEEFVRARKVRATASPLIQSPLAGLADRIKKAAPAAPLPPPPEPGPAPPPADSRAPGFGAFIRSIIDQAVGDPQGRARLYSETVRHVESAVARHVSEATHRMLLEKQGLINSSMRAEHVFSAVAEGNIVVDQDGRILMMDPAAEAIIGKGLPEVAGKQILESLGGGGKFVTIAKDLVLPENRPLSGEMRVGGAQDELESFRRSVAVVHDDHGRVVGTCAVVPHAAKLKELQDAKEGFYASVTHDLKAPLTSISAALEVLADRAGPRLAAEDREFLDISLRNTQTLKALIEDLLDFSKIAAGRMTVDSEAADVAPLLEECVRTITPWAGQKNVVLAVDPPPPPGLPKAMADRRRIAQVLANLASNAVKHTPGKGRVLLSAAPGEGPHAGKVVVSVRDTGSGISLEDQSHLFERYRQGRAGARVGGVGMGLAIVKELVALHGGEVWFRSEPGKGSTFFFSLPVSGS